MPTPKSVILDNFHSQFQDFQILDPDLEQQFFSNALGYFELDLYTLTYEDNNAQIEENLSRSEINLLGKLMYKSYLNRERDRILKINNIVGRDIKLTAMGDAKSQMNKTYDSLSGEIEDLINKLKDNTYL